MNQVQKIDFNAILLQPFVFTGVKAAKEVTKDTVKKLVRQYHPAIHAQLKTVPAKV